MSSAYLYVFTPSDFDQNDVGDFLNTVDGVETWFYSIPNSMFIVGTAPAKRLSRLLTAKFGQHRHFVTFISKAARAGWLPKSHWDMFPVDEAKD